MIDLGPFTEVQKAVFAASRFIRVGGVTIRQNDMDGTYTLCFLDSEGDLAAKADIPMYSLPVNIPVTRYN